ncbi:MAG: TonB-dependent receptor plug domain-containing protein [Saccharospirillum sp.]
MKQHWVGIALVCLATSSNASDWALEPVVVTGTGTEALLEESPVAVQVLDRVAIENSQAATLEELLDKVPELQLKQTHGQTGASVMLNGLTEKHVLILLDGVPLNQANASGVDTRALKLADIERIEVVSANASALYGSAAMGGVIQLITRAPTEPAFEMGIQVRQAESDLEHVPTQTDVDARWATSLWGGYSASSLALTRYAGFDSSPDTWAEDEPNGLGWNLSQSWRYEGERQHQLTGRWRGMDLALPAQHALTANPNERRTREHFVSGQYQVDGEDSRWLFNGHFASGLSEHDRMNTAAVDLERRYQAFNGAVDARRLTQWFGHEQIWGARLSTATLAQQKAEPGERDVDEIPTSDQVSVELYAQDGWFVTDRIELISGVRGHWDPDFGVFVAPNLATRVDLTTRQYLRASMGLGYRVPDLKERFYEFDHSIYGYRVLGNPNLQPERSVSAQLEWVLDGLSVEGFYRDVSDLISTAQVGIDANGVTRNQYINVDEAEIRGINVSGEFELGSHRLAAHGQWLHAVNAKTGDALPQRPEYQLDLIYQWLFNLVRPQRLSTSIKRTGPQFFGSEETLPVDPYNQVDLSWGVEINARFKLTASIDNLGDVQSPSRGATDALPLRGRTYGVALRYTH